MKRYTLAKTDFLQGMSPWTIRQLGPETTRPLLQIPHVSDVPYVGTNINLPGPGTLNRPAVWAHEQRRGLVLSQQYGIGRPQGPVNERGMMPVRFYDGAPEISVYAPNLQSCNEAEDYAAALARRVQGPARNAPLVAAHDTLHQLLQARWDMHAPPARLLDHYGIKEHRTAVADIVRAMASNQKHEELRPQRITNTRAFLEHLLFGASVATGIDIIKLGLHLTITEDPARLTREYALRDSDGENRHSAHFAAKIRRLLSPDAIQGCLEQQAWYTSWQQRRIPHHHVMTAGLHYPAYYNDHWERPHNITPLYYRHHAGDADAIDDIVSHLQPVVTAWTAQWRKICFADDVVIVPMPGSQGLNTSIAAALQPKSVVPALARDEDAYTPMEHQRATNKLRSLANSLHFDSRWTRALQGKHVLLLDDAITDAASYMMASQLLYANADPVRVGMVALGQTIRHPRELDNPFLAVVSQDSPAPSHTNIPPNELAMLFGEST